MPVLPMRAPPKRYAVRMSEDVARHIREAVKAGDPALLDRALSGLNRGQKEAAVRAAQTAVVNDLNAVTPASGDPAPALDTGVFTQELTELRLLLARISRA